MNKGTGIVIGLIAIIAVAFGIYMVDFDMDGGALPDVEVSGGEMPNVDADVGDIDVGTKTEEITVPDVDIDTEQAEVEVPTVDVTPPGDDS